MIVIIKYKIMQNRCLSLICPAYAKARNRKASYVLLCSLSIEKGLPHFILVRQSYNTLSFLLIYNDETERLTSVRRSYCSQEN